MKSSKSILILFSMCLILFVSCKKVQEQRFNINEKAWNQRAIFKDSIFNPELGIHYIEIDTATMELLVKYDDDKMKNLNELENWLTEQEMLVVDSIEVTEPAALVSSEKSDSIQNDTQNQSAPESEPVVIVPPEQEEEPVQILEDSTVVDSDTLL